MPISLSSEGQFSLSLDSSTGVRSGHPQCRAVRSGHLRNFRYQFCLTRGVQSAPAALARCRLARPGHTSGSTLKHRDSGNRGRLRKTPEDRRTGAKCLYSWKEQETPELRRLRERKMERPMTDQAENPQHHCLGANLPPIHRGQFSLSSEGQFSLSPDSISTICAISAASSVSPAMGGPAPAAPARVHSGHLRNFRCQVLGCWYCPAPGVCLVPRDGSDSSRAAIATPLFRACG